MTKEIILYPFPKYAKIIKGEWKKENGNVWCKIIESNCTELSLSHPTHGSFAWVSISDCVFTNKIDKKNLSLFKKDGTYVYKDGEQVCYSKDTKNAYSQIEKLIGKWSMKTARKWSNYIFIEYKNGEEVESFTC